MEISCHLDKEFKVIVTKMLVQLFRQVDKLSENFNRR